MISTVLVTGGTGCIAGYPIRPLLAEGWTVHATLRCLSRGAGLRRVLARSRHLPLA